MSESRAEQHITPETETAAGAAPDLVSDAELNAQEPGAVLISVFRQSSSHPLVLDAREVGGAVQELEDVIGVVESEGASIRGWYDTSGLRGDADLMLVLTGAAIEDLQWAVRELRRTSLLRPLIRTWSTAGFSAGSEQFADVPSKQWFTVSPALPGGFDGLEDLLDEESEDEEWDPELDGDWEGDAELDSDLTDASDAEEDGDDDEDEIAVHHLTAAGLGDQSWLLALESDDLLELVSLVSDLTDDPDGPILDEPRFTGRQIEVVEIVEVLQ
ncbi:chlorite dismutase family protein [Leucobacter sp. CSA2]|uniref:hydrogen peroxide-dependent heme synthase n=1 Tax=Leucobacter edaphi TaxID=2796472 RepID=A0A934QCX0_9MICO|nr:chlorite dismutase family protein [Leucobacter edaphi]MBK0422309.1 chlorite dismutase family protein [Leucobacter edaphi]